MDTATTEAPPTLQSILLADTLKDAGRKTLLAEFAKANYDADISTETVLNARDMQVRVQHIQFALKLLKSQIHTKAKGRYKRSLRRLSNELSKWRQLDYLIGDLQTFDLGIDAKYHETLQGIIEKLQEQRNNSVGKLVKLPNGKAQERLERVLHEYVPIPMGEIQDVHKVTPSQIRHVLPQLIYHHIGAIQAYQGNIENASFSMLRSLHIEFKRLQNTLALFESVLGKQIAEFNAELNSILNTLEKLHDSASVNTNLKRLINADKKKHMRIFEAYSNFRADRDQALISEFKHKWNRFNSRKVQQKLSTALLALYNN